MGSINLTSYRTFLSTRSKSLCAKKTSSRKKIPEIHFRTSLGSLEADFLVLRERFWALFEARRSPQALPGCPECSRERSRAPPGRLASSPGTPSPPPQNHEKPMNSLRKTRFSEKLALERFPRAQAAPGRHFGPVGPPRPPPPQLPPLPSKRYYLTTV